MGAEIELGMEAAAGDGEEAEEEAKEGDEEGDEAVAFGSGASVESLTRINATIRATNALLTEMRITAVAEPMFGLGIMLHGESGIPSNSKARNGSATSCYRF